MTRVLTPAELHHMRLHAIQLMIPRVMMSCQTALLLIVVVLTMVLIL